MGAAKGQPTLGDEGLTSRQLRVYAACTKDAERWGMISLHRVGDALGMTVQHIRFTVLKFVRLGIMRRVYGSSRKKGYYIPAARIELYT